MLGLLAWVVNRCGKHLKLKQQQQQQQKSEVLSDPRTIADV